MKNSECLCKTPELASFGDQMNQTYVEKYVEKVKQRLRKVFTVCSSVPVYEPAHTVHIVHL